MGVVDFFKATVDLGQVDTGFRFGIVVIVCCRCVVCFFNNGIRAALRAWFRVFIGWVDKAIKDIANAVRILIGICKCLEDGLHCTWVVRQRRHHFTDAFFDTLGDHNLAFAGQQLNGAHFTHIHTDRVCGAANVAFDRCQCCRSFFGSGIIGGIVHEQGFTIGSHFRYRNTDVVNHTDDVFNLIRVGNVIWQMVVHLSIGEVALLFTFGNEFFQSGLLGIR